MFLFDVFFRLSKEKRLPFYSPNLKCPTDQQIGPQVDHDFCLGPIRDFRVPTKQFSKDIKLQRVFQVRDPRDILVSQYFSFGWNHTEQNFDREEQQTRDKIREQSIDEYVLEPNGAAYFLERRMKPLLRALRDNNGLSGHRFTTVTYEEMVLDFPSWLSRIITIFDFNQFGWRSRPMISAKYRFRYRNAFRPDKSKQAHKRHVLPGEHTIRLRPETIHLLNQQFEPLLNQMGYPLNRRSVA